MRQCIHCKKRIDGFWRFLKTKHPECDALYNSGKKEILNISIQSALKWADEVDVPGQISKIAQAHFVPEKDLGIILVKAWESALDKVLEDNVLSAEEEKNLMAFASHFSLDESQLDVHGAYTKAAMNGCLRDVLEGKIPHRQKIDGLTTFNFQKDETPVWLFKGVECYEEKIKRTYEGRSSGVSVKIAKGVYYRTGAFRGHPIETPYMALIGTGLLALTNKHFYFSSPLKSFRVPFSKIVSFTSFDDGIGFTKDGVSGKPQFFKTGNGWFTYNLALNLSKL